jgi:hypothetical protein
MKTVSTISFSRTSISLSDDCSGECELKLADVSQRITSTETTLALLECKLRSIPGLEYDGAPPPSAAAATTTTTVNATTADAAPAPGPAADVATTAPPAAAAPAADDASAAAGGGGGGGAAELVTMAKAGVGKGDAMADSAASAVAAAVAAEASGDASVDDALSHNATLNDLLFGAPSTGGSDPTEGLDWELGRDNEHWWRLKASSEAARAAAARSIGELRWKFHCSPREKLALVRHELRMRRRERQERRERAALVRRRRRAGKESGTPQGAQAPAQPPPQKQPPSPSTPAARPLSPTKPSSQRKPVVAHKKGAQQTTDELSVEEIAAAELKKKVAAAAIALDRKRLLVEIGEATVVRARVC